MIRNSDYVMSLIIDPYNYARKAQVGVDLTVKSINKMESDFVTGIIRNDTSLGKNIKNDFTRYEAIPLKYISASPEAVYTLYPGVYSITFDQGLKPLLSDNTAFIYHRSSLGRNGVIIQSAVYDPGFETPNMGAIMTVNVPIIIEDHARVAQIVIYTNEEVSTVYDGQYKGHKDIK